MLPKEIIAKVRKIEISTRCLVDELTAGGYHSIFKGKGIEFAEVREYVEDDDVRDIDWNVTAKMNHLFVKQFTEERELNVFLLIDVSASVFSNQCPVNYRDLSIELVSLFLFSAIRNNDRVGMLLFSDKIELNVPARKGKNHGLRLLRELVAYEINHKKTNINLALETFQKTHKRRATVFLISDLFDENFFKTIQAVNKRNDLIIIHLNNDTKNFNFSGFINFEDSESGRTFNFLANEKGRKLYRKNYQLLMQKNLDICKKCGIDVISITLGKDYVSELRSFFKRRKRR